MLNVVETLIKAEEGRVVLYKVVVFRNYNSALSQVYCVITASFSL